MNTQSKYKSENRKTKHDNSTTSEQLENLKIGNLETSEKTDNFEQLENPKLKNRKHLTNQTNPNNLTNQKIGQT